tara:strand:- start:3335 stop:4333 length:999 start_codon:yes stop_codon:yes gene_type:complete
MAYTSGSTIAAADYNGFVANNADNVNKIWSTGSGTDGYGETALTTVSAAATITATQWATLNSKISAMASHQGTAITSRANPTAGTTIAILTALGTDITSLDANRGDAVASGAQTTTFSGASSKTTNTGSADAAWTITFTHTVNFGGADAARYFFNAGGRIKWVSNKSSTGQDGDAEWNDLATTLVGDIYITGGSDLNPQSIAATNYTGTTKVGGTGSPNTLATGTGWFNLTTSNTQLYRQYADTAPYTGQYISINAKTAGSGTQLVLTTTWVDPGGSATPGGTNIITGGTATGSPFSSFGTAPASVVTLYVPSSTYLTSASWGAPTIAASVA